MTRSLLTACILIAGATISWGACSHTLITGTIYCEGAATNGAGGPTTAVTVVGTTFASGHTLTASVLLLRPKSPYTNGATANIGASDTTMTINAPAIVTGTASTTNMSATVTLDATSYGALASGLGQTITATGIAPGTTIVEQLGGNQVLLSQAATATSSTACTIQYTWPTTTGLALVSVGASGGSGYALGDILNVNQGGASGGQVMVTSIGAGGAVTGVSITASSPANFFTASGYSIANNLSTTAFTGSGSGAQIDINQIGFIATLSAPVANTNFEKVIVTGVSGNNWTMIRGTPSAPIYGTFGIPHDAGGLIGVYNPGPYPTLPSNMTDTAGNTWILANAAQTENQDNNTVPIAVYYTTFTSGTAATANTATHDIITFTNYFSNLGLLSVSVVWYSGLGSPSGINNAQATVGNAAPSGTLFNASMSSSVQVQNTAGQSWPVVPGDLCIVTAAGLPTGVVNGANTYPLGGSGTVTTAGTTVTWVSGTAFSTVSLDGPAWNGGQPILINGTTYHLAQTPTSGVSITTIETLPTNATPVAYFVADRGVPSSPTSGWILRQADGGGRMWVIDGVATGYGCAGGVTVGPTVDGVLTAGLAFHPSSAPTSSGQSLVLTGSQAASSSSVPAQGINAPCRAEFQIQLGASIPTGALIGSVPACGISIVTVAGTPGNLQVYSSGKTGWSCCVNIPISSFSNQWMLLRYQQIPSGAGGSFTWEAWDQNAVLQFSDQLPYTGTTGSYSAGASVGSQTSVNAAWGFFRLFTTNVPFGSPPPTFAQNGNLLEWKFNGNLNDSSGNSYTASGVSPASSCGSAPCYQMTAYQNQVFANLYTTQASNWPAWLASYPNFGIPWDTSGNHTNYLDCTGSFTWIEAGGQPSCSWSISGGPNSPTITSPSSTVTTVTGTQFGTPANPGYQASVTVADSAGNMATTSRYVGALSIDANGVVHPTDPNVQKVLAPVAGLTTGAPMMAIGYGSGGCVGSCGWSYSDERMVAAMTLQIANNTYYSQQTTWKNTGAGTVSYPFAGIGAQPGQVKSPVCQLGANLNSTDANITIANVQSCPVIAANVFPTAILIGGNYAPKEMIRVCSTSATTGTATVGICYGGRSTGFGQTVYGSGPIIAPSTWASGTIVGEYKIAGAGTNFGNDSASPSRSICPASQALGYPAPMGLIAYNTGTSGVASASNTVTGSGTAWTSALVGDIFVIHQTYNSGANSINWWSTITAASGTSITLNKTAPVLDSGTGFSYEILSPIYLSLTFSAWGGTNNYQLLQGGIYCESGTAAFAIAEHDVSTLDATTFTGQSYSYKTVLGCCGAFGPNFYQTGLMLLTGYETSGYAPAWTAANQINGYWCRDPEWGCGYAEGEPLLYGAAYGGFADLILNSSTLNSWTNFEQLISNGATYVSAHPAGGSPPGCNSTEGFDTRDQSYTQMPTVFGAAFDPSGNQSTWITAMSAMLNRDTACARSDYSFAVPELPQYENGSSFAVPVTLTNGSTTLTAGAGVDFTNVNGYPFCAGVASGTIQVTNGSTSATLISGSLSGGSYAPFNIIITDTTSSPIYPGQFEFSYVGSAVTLAGVWPGASGTFNFLVQEYNSSGYGGATGFGLADYSDADNLRLKKNWGCTGVNSTTATLNRPWDDSSGTYYAGAAPNYGGAGGCCYFQQPFMHGILNKKLGATQLVPSVASGYAALAAPTSAWFRSTGFDTNTSGAYYTRVNQMCEPFVTANSSTLFGTIHGGNSYTPNCGISGLLGYVDGEYPERVNSAEALSSVANYYVTQCQLGTSQCNAARAFGDLAYGAIFGNPLMTQAGFYSDTHYVRDELSNTSLGAYKWSGFFFGMSNARVWPALRLMLLNLNLNPVPIFSGKAISGIGIQ